MVRRIRAIAWATAIEILGEPFCLLVTLSALALSVLAPAIHYHQFGDPTRMARDAGFSALLLGGCLYAAYGAFKTYRREVACGTMQVALAMAVSRTTFFLSKFLGCLLAYFAFVATVSAVSYSVVNGAAIGGEIARQKADIARLWGPSLALALAPMIVALSTAALLNRFAHFRFVLTTHFLILVLAVAGIGYRFDGALALRIEPVVLLFALPPLVVMAATAAFAARFRTSLAAAFAGVFALTTVPLLGNYCLSDVLSNGGRLPQGYGIWALLALVPAVLAFLALGVALVNGRDAV